MLQTQDKEMVVVAFVKGMTTSPFSDSLIKNRAKTLSEVHERATTHIEAEEVMVETAQVTIEIVLLEAMKPPLRKERTKGDGRGPSTQKSV